MKAQLSLLLLFTVALSLMVPAQSPATPDLSWDGDGILELGSWSWQTRPFCRMGGNQLHVALRSVNQSIPKVMRYRTDGSLDPDFGQNGIREITFGQWITQIKDIQVTATGEVYLLVSNSMHFIMRLRPDGSDDPNFQIAPLPLAMTTKSVQLLDDGRFLVCGHNDDAVLVCYLPTGALDTTFGQGGYVTLDTYQDTEDFYIAGSMTNHNIVAMGNTLYDDRGGCGWFSAALVAIYTPQGQLLSSNINSIGSYEGYSTMLTVPEGGFVLNGFKKLNKYNADGNPSPNFNAIHLYVQGTITFWSATKDHDGHLLAVATQYPDLNMLRLNANGSPDTDFGPNGAASIPMDTHDALLVQADGKLLASGFTPATPDAASIFVVRRFNGSYVLAAEDTQSPAGFYLTAYPNPAHGHLISLQFDSPKSGRLLLHCRDIAGREIMPATTVPLHAGLNEGIALPLPTSMASGVYFLQAQADGFDKTIKLVVQ